MRNIEIEFRGQITKKKYTWLHTFLRQNAKDMGEDDKDTKFYILPDRLFKVVNEESKKKAKISLKNNRIGRGSAFDEFEVEINQYDFEKAIELFDHLELPCKTMWAWQKRHNYKYKGVEIAVKYSDHWGYHVEMEIVINVLNDRKKAEQKIKRVAKELKIKLMSEKEMQILTNAIESKL